jgi:hypothetical protein
MVKATNTFSVNIYSAPHRIVNLLKNWDIIIPGKQLNTDDDI